MQLNAQARQAAALLQSSTKSTLLAAQGVVGKINHDVSQMAAQREIRMGGPAGAGGGAAAGGARGGPLSLT